MGKNFKLRVNCLILKPCLPLPKHLIVIPVGGAKYETLKYTLKGIANQNYQKNLIFISLSFEERLIKKDPSYYEELKYNIKTEFSEFGERLMIFVHPENLPNEAIGAAANRSWGNRKAIEILEKSGYNLNDFITTSPDEDIYLHPEYLGALTYKYLTNPKRLQRFYQTAVYLFTNNYWQVPTPIRTWGMSLTLPVLASSVTHRTWRETWSCYSLNLAVMKEVDYWDTSIGIDDSPFFWRPFDYFDGDFECEVFYTPLYADAVYHPNKITNYIAQYKQLVRWGWGVIAFPIAIKVLLENKNIPFHIKVKKLAIMLELIILMKITTVIFTISVPLLTLFHDNLYLTANHISFAYIFSFLMQLLTLFMIPLLYFKFQLIPSKDNKGNFKNIFMKLLNFFLEIPLHFIMLYTFALIPFLVGPTQMMWGKEHHYKVIQKY